MHLALICPDLTGHLNPMATLGRELARRGHRVTLISRPPAGATAGRAGFDFRPVAAREHESGEAAADLAALAERTGLAAFRLTGQILARWVAAFLRDAPETVRAVRPDAAVVDQVCPEAGTVAEHLRLPYVVACNALALHREPGVPPWFSPFGYRPGWVGRVRNRLANAAVRVIAAPIVAEVRRFRRAHRMPPIGAGYIEGYGLAQVAQQPAFFDFPRDRLPPHFHYTGPWHEPGRDKQVAFPWEQLDGRPVVYASLGTMQNRLKHVFAAILDGCAELPVQVVLSLGRADATWDGSVPGNAVVVPFAPQLDLLDRSAVVVTHAGLNTTLEALARGKPMLCLPVTNDQPGVASRVRYLGAGEVILPRKATAEAVRAAVGRLLSNPAYRTAAEGCAKRMAGTNGLGLAADVVEQALVAGRRVERTG